MMPVMIAILLLPFVLLLASCQNSDVNLNEREKIIAELAVSGATIRFIEEAPDSKREKRAKAVKAAVAATRVALSDDVDNQAELQEFLTGLIPGDGTLNPYEVEAARAIVQLILVDIGEFANPTGVFDPETKALVLRYAAAVERAADAELAA